MQVAMIIILVLAVAVVASVFGSELQKFLAVVIKAIMSKVGASTKHAEFRMRRHMFLNHDSLTTSVYRWLNEQIICLGLKKYNITVMGYLVFWAVVTGIVTVSIAFYIGFGVFTSIFLYLAVFALMILLTRLRVTSVIEFRESVIMDAIDLIIPDISNGVQNAIIRYKDNFHASIRPDFSAFLDNINKGYTFTEAMLILSDSLGSVFKDFAQKAIFFEELGEKDMVDIFADIVEINHLRRELRYSNKLAFNQLRLYFIVSTLAVLGYVVFMVAADPVTSKFLLKNSFGNFLIVLDIVIVVGVLGYITTIRSREL